MIYTFRIKDKTKKAKSIINMLKALKDDYDFIEISENSDSEIEKEINHELDIRYDMFLENSKGKGWDDLKKEIV
jgi:hypothetical protein